MYQSLIQLVYRMNVKADLKYVEITYKESENDPKEHKCLINIKTLYDSLKKLDKLAPTRIITNIDILCSINKKL